ncbi:hypothetical protein ACFL5Q_06365 [Planctomycetota bacterium]
MTENGSQEYTSVIFLDTNVVHCSKLVLAFAEIHGLDVLTADLDSFKQELADKGVGAVDDYVKGYWILRYLKERTDERSVLLYSPITQLELLCGSLRGEAIKRAVNVGVPNRWFSRVTENEIRGHLEPDGYTQVQAEQTDAESRFGSAGITLDARPVDREVWQLAHTVMENVFIDVQDCVVYSSALVSQSSELITLDGYLRSTVGYTSNPGSAPDPLKQRFQSVKSALVRTYAAIAGCNEDEVTLPDKKGIREIKSFLNGEAA